MRLITYSIAAILITLFPLKAQAYGDIEGYTYCLPVDEMHKALNSEGFFIFRVDPIIYARFDGTYVVLSESGNQSCIVYDGAGLEVDEGQDS
jgi:hypothetical protein